MNFIYDLIPEEFIRAIGWTIFHSIWQGALIAILLFGILFLTKTNNSRLRYILSALALFFFFGISAITFTQVYNSNKEVSSLLSETSIGSSTSSNVLHETAPSGNNTNLDYIAIIKSYFVRQMPLIVTLWLFGFLVFSLRFVGGVLYVQKLRNEGIKTLENSWIHRLRELSGIFGLNKLVQIFESSKVKSPITIGYLKPIILLPIGMISGLPKDQVEAIIIHELAHIKRYDFLINLFQAFIETIFFYHPAVWWISSTIKSERENCCDDLTLELCGGSLLYFKALYNLQQICTAENEFALAAIGRKNQLFRRINRMTTKDNNRSYGVKFAAFAVLLTIIAAVSIHSTSSAKEYSRNLSSVSFINPITSLSGTSSLKASESDITSIADTISMKKGKRTLKFYDKENGDEKRFKVKFDNGKLEELFIDGEKVDEEDFAKYEGKIYQRLEDYDAGMKEYKKGIEKYKESLKAYKESMKSYREKMKNFRGHYDSDIDSSDIDLSELKELANKIRENVRVHIPPVYIPPIHIPPIDLSELKEGLNDFDHEKFKEEMKEWKENFKEEMKDWKVDMKDFKMDMEKFNKEMKKNGPGSEIFKKSMEELKVNMGNLKMEMKKLKSFIHDTKDELVKDKLMDEGDDLDDFTLSKDEMIVGGKKVSPELHKKYLELYKKHFGKELTGDKKFRIND